MLLVMGEITQEQPTHPGSQQADQPATKKKQRHASTWIALASAATAIVAAGISFYQVNVASKQNTVAEQEQLVTLTGTIAQTLAQEQTTINQAGGNLTGAARTTAEAEAQLAVITQLEVQGQAAAVLISDLHGAGVAGIEYVQVARALDAAGDTGQAITFYTDAVNAPPYDVVTRANALRNQGALYYSLGQDAPGHRDYLKAASLYKGNVQMTQALKDNSIAQAYLVDAGYQLVIRGCHLATTDFKAAVRALAPIGTSGENTAVQALIAIDTAAYKSKCASTG